MPSEAILTQSLERLAELVGDPKPLIYAELFRRYPDHEGLFFLDPNGDVRGEMLSQAFDLLMRADDDDKMAELMVGAARFAHDGYGVSVEDFNSFFGVIRDVTQAELGEEWGPEFEASWQSAIDQLLQA